MKIYSYVILENYLYLIASSKDIGKTMQKLESYTAYELLKRTRVNCAGTANKFAVILHS